MKKFIIVALIISATLFSGCTSSYHTNNYDNDESIAGNNTSFTITHDNQDIENNRITCKATFEGNDEVWAYEADKDESVSISYSLQVSNGEAKIVFIDAEGNISNIAEANSTTDNNSLINKSLHIKPGYNFIKIVGKNMAKLDFTIECDEGKFNELGDIDI